MESIKIYSYTCFITTIYHRKINPFNTGGDYDDNQGKLFNLIFLWYLLTPSVRLYDNNHIVHCLKHFVILSAQKIFSRLHDIFIVLFLKQFLMVTTDRKEASPFIKQKWCHNSIIINNISTRPYSDIVLI